MSSIKKIAIIGGGAGGFFTAINTAENNPNVHIDLFEKGTQVLGKVKVSGGGRCNVTHACFEPKELVKFYPRGGRELLGPFHTFMTGDTMEWFENRGVSLKIEDDNRVFPVSDSSQSIIDCFTQAIGKLNITVHTQKAVSNFQPLENGNWIVTTDHSATEYDALVIACGGNATTIWNTLEDLGYEIIPPMPSLFTFNIKDSRINELSGLAVERVGVKIQGTKLQELGPMLITHWGMSGPAILKLSAVAARHLHELNYRFSIVIDFAPNCNDEEVKESFLEQRTHHPKKAIVNTPLFDIPKRLWQRLTEFSGIHANLIWAELPQKEQNKLLETIKRATFSVDGKSTNKEEFVTCGGVDLKKVNFSNFSSKLHSNLYFVGEVLNIDALTGGFNFQAAWTGAYIASMDLAK